MGASIPDNLDKSIRSSDEGTKKFVISEFEKTVKSIVESGYYNTKYFELKVLGVLRALDVIGEDLINFAGSNPKAEARMGLLAMGISILGKEFEKLYLMEEDDQKKVYEDIYSVFLRNPTYSYFAIMLLYFLPEAYENFKQKAMEKDEDSLD